MQKEPSDATVSYSLFNSTFAFHEFIILTFFTTIQREFSVRISSLARK